MMDYLWTGGLLDWTLVRYMEKGVKLTRPGHRCLLGHMVSYLLSQIRTRLCVRIHT
jgi:hypothetical protein